MNRLSHYSFLLFLIVFSFSLEPIRAEVADNFVRAPRREFVYTSHQRSESDPQQVHISLAGRYHMKISWITTNKEIPSIVEYGQFSGQYNKNTTGEQTSYGYLLYKSGKIHHVKIGPLEPGTTYYYKCGGHGPEFSFKTPSSTFPFEFAIVGDLGQTEWTTSTLSQLHGQEYDVFLLPGDLAYADFLQPLWDTFGRLVEPYASQRPWMVIAGNHDVESFPVLKQPHPFKSYNARWQMPHAESQSPSNLYYSFEVVGTHVLMLGSYTDFKEGSDQYKWLETDLKNIDRETTPWVVALVHAPWYNTNEAHQGEGESMRKAMEKLLYNARVDVVFAGHVHAYERFTRIYDNKADPCGPMYITIGDGGNREGLARKYKKPTSPLSLFREASFGHGRLKILDGTRAHWSWHRNNDSNSFVADEVWLNSLSATTACRVHTSETSNTHDEL